MWSDAYLEARVLSADPLELICLLYQHAVDTVRDARGHLAGGDIAGRARAISKALAIVGELNSSLDHGAGSAISGNLEQLYTYITIRLTEGNIHKQDAPLAEAERLLSTLADGWNQAHNRVREAAIPMVPAAGGWQEAGEVCAAGGWSA